MLSRVLMRAYPAAHLDVPMPHDENADEAIDCYDEQQDSEAN